MTGKPIFVATHPRACSTAFERVFMTCRDSLQCAHEPFGDSFYYGPERLSERYSDEELRESSGFSKTTYQDVLNRLERDGSEGKRVFIKDMAYYLMPPDGKPASLAPSVCNEKTNGHVNGSVNGTTNGHVNGHVNGTTNSDKKVNSHSSEKPTTNGDAAASNPTVLPLDVLEKYHFTFLIRHPRRGIPSFYRCTIPPLDEVTGFYHFMPNEAGYVELRKLFDFLREQKLVGPRKAGESNGAKDDRVSITVIDADDLLDKPQEVLDRFCKETGLEFTTDMLKWDEGDQRHAADAFEKWKGFHEDAIHSSSLSPRSPIHKRTPSEEAEDEEWRRKYGEEGQKVIRECVNENIPHYEYLKSFAIQV